MARRASLKDPDLAIKIIEEDGGVILTDFTTPALVDQVNADAAPYINAIIEKRLSRGLPRETTRCTLLFGRSETAREVWLQQAGFLGIINHFLRTVSAPYNFPAGAQISTEAILSAAATLDVGPGVKVQGLHRDDFIWQRTHCRSGDGDGEGDGDGGGEGDGYVVGGDVGMGLYVPGVGTTAENGATLYIPGSHLWDHSRRPRYEEAVPVVMDVGEAFVALASTVHAGGANTTSRSRPLHGFFFCRSYLRPEENQHMWWSREEVRAWSLAAQKQAGYIIDNPDLGHCDGINPVDKVRD